MGSFKTLAFVVLFWALLSPKNIFAEVHNHNGHHQKEITSPFDVKKEKTSLHCLLKLHALNEPCPHSNSVKGKSISFAIASDCGGKTSGAIPNTATFSYDFSEATSVLLITNYWRSAFPSDHFFAGHGFNDSSFPPPRAI
jgi:hypothetical protein